MEPRPPRRSPRKPVVEHKHGLPWYTGEHYLTRQPWRTFLRSNGHSRKNNATLLANRLRRLVPHTSNTTALEIGPGPHPFLERFRFKKIMYLEQSAQLAEDLWSVRGDRVRRNKLVVRGDVRNLPLSPQNHFGIVVMNEVLTHVEPKKRLDVLKELARRTNRLLIVDRPRPVAASTLWRVDPKEEEHFSQGEKVTQETYVTMEPLVRYLRENGWDVLAERVGENNYYAILSATKK